MSDWKEKVKLRLPAIFLLAASLLFWGLYDRYKVVGDPYFVPITLEHATAVQGDCSEDDGHFILKVEPGGKIARVRFRASLETNKPELIRVRGRMKSAGVVEGKNSWNCARLILVQRDAENKWIPCEHSVLSMTETQRWTRGASVFEVQGNTRFIDLQLEQSGKEGAAEFDRLVVEPVQLRTSYIWLRNLFAGLWILMGAVYFFRCRLHRRKLKLLILLNALAIVVGVLMPEKWVQETSEHIEEDAVKIVMAIETTKPKPVTPSVKPSETKPAPKPTTASAPPKETPPSPEQKAKEKVDEVSESIGGANGMGHFLLFASLCFLVYWSAALERQHRSFYFKVALDILLFAAVTESLQFLTMDRTPGVKDWFVDFCGMLTALLLFVVLKFCFIQIRRRENSVSQWC
ncbi:MAG: VanZ family protein [Pontiellaceae bacterium]|nr:VanZ family protein [Pontiellaceae bacterium]